MDINDRVEKETTPLTVDLTGLPPESVSAVKSLIGMLRAKAAAALSAPSVFNLFGKARHLRTSADIAQQIHDERSGWGEA